MLSSYYQISECVPDDVRRERVQHIKLKLASRAYTVATEEVAAKLIEYMMNPGRTNYLRKARGPGKKTGSQSTDAARSGTIQNRNDISG